MKPIYEITIDGKTIDVAKRLISLAITDKADTESDTLTLTIADPDNALALPRRGVELSASIGYQHSGLVNKGLFIVDEIEYSSPPNILTITARAADFRQQFREKREVSYHSETLGGILRTVSARAGLTLNIAPALDATFIVHIDQTESDSHFMARLAKLYDATGTIKQGRLIFTPKGTGKKVDGVDLHSSTIRESECKNWRLTIQDREHEITGVRARFFNRGGGNTDVVTVGSKSKTITLPQSFPNAAEATSAAAAELSRRKRGGQRVSVTLSAGNPAIIAEQPITLTGFKQGVDGSGWTVDAVTHTLGSSGLSSRVNLEFAT